VEVAGVVAAVPHRDGPTSVDALAPQQRGGDRRERRAQRECLERRVATPVVDPGVEPGNARFAACDRAQIDRLARAMVRSRGGASASSQFVGRMPRSTTTPSTHSFSTSSSVTGRNGSARSSTSAGGSGDEHGAGEDDLTLSVDVARERVGDRGDDLLAALRVEVGGDDASGAEVEGGGSGGGIKPGCCAARLFNASASASSSRCSNKRASWYSSRR
jgi:hypothetical protein